MKNSKRRIEKVSENFKCSYGIIDRSLTENAIEVINRRYGKTAKPLLEEIKEKQEETMAVMKIEENTRKVKALIENLEARNRYELLVNLQVKETKLRRLLTFAKKTVEFLRDTGILKAIIEVLANTFLHKKEIKDLFFM